MWELGYRKRLGVLLAAFLWVGAAACSGDDAPAGGVDAGSRIDSGARDGAIAGDAPASLDAPASDDTGVVLEDSGGGDVDSGRRERDAGRDRDRDASGGLPEGSVCMPGGDPCGAGLSCCYPCGIDGCDFVCEPTCSPGTPGCVGGCIMRI